MTGKPPAIFYVPHADDETISMGVDIMNHAAAGRDIQIILLSAGSSPWLREVLNGAQHDGYHGYRHNPEAESYQLAEGASGLSEDQVAHARIMEFLSAAGQLTRETARPAVLGATNSPEGYQLAQVKELMTTLEKSYPGASHKTMSYTDPHPDHRTAGQALAVLRAEGVIKDARFYVQPNEQANADAATKGGVKPYRADVASGSDRARLARAIAAYRAWNPASGSYAIGETSVGVSLDAAQRGAFNLVHI